MIPQFVTLETIIRRAPVALRFLDLVRGVTVSDGLTVTAQQVGASYPVLMALTSPLSGVYGFRNLPGLRPFEVGDRPASDWCGPTSPPGEPSAEELLDVNALRSLIRGDEGAPPPNFLIYMEDRLERFVPQLLMVCLPKEQLIEVPLFSAPARPVPPGLGVVRGELWDRGTNAPASWAMVTASPDGSSTYVTVADARGMFTLFIPYASALPPLVGSPPHGGGAIDQLTWNLTVQVFYQPSLQRKVPGFDPPDTRSILEQGLAQVYDTLSTHAASLARSIRLGQDLIIKTDSSSRILVDAA